MKAIDMRQIEHVVVIMLENRGFDSVLGYLYSPDDGPEHVIPEPLPGQLRFDGLAYLDTKTLTNKAVVEGRTYERAPAPSVRATNSPGKDPHEEFAHVNVQLFEAEAPAPGAQPTMKGFLQDYASLFSGDRFDCSEQIMRMYTPADLPVLSALARAYAVSDAWFSSVPTQTNANRAFSLAGTSLGLVDNGFLSPSSVSAKLADDRFKTDTLWNVLSNNGFSDWKIFWYDPYPPLLSSVPYTRRCFPNMEKIPDVNGHFSKMEDDFFTLAERGALPALSYIEPKWGGEILDLWSVMGNEAHPPSDVTPAEALIERIYHSLTRNKASWEKTLLVIMFDEHGGTYDHVKPPAATPPWGTATPAFELQYKFKFDRYGVRVPAILVSPLIEQRTVLRSTTAIPFDHTSFIATILEWRGIPREKWGLGERVARAPTFAGVISRTMPRTDDALAPRRAPATKTPLRFGSPFHLEHTSGAYVTGAYTGTFSYYPTLGKGAPVALDLRLGFGEVPNRATVQIRTAEDLAPMASSLPIFVGVRNFLGAWTTDPNCYYYSSVDTENYQEESWIIARTDGGTGPILYGDTVSLTSVKFAGQRLVKSGDYLTTKAGGADTWTIVPAQAPAARATVANPIAGGAEVYQLDRTGDVLRYDPKSLAWNDIGGPGAAFAANDVALYRLSPARDAVWQYSLTTMKWTQINEAAGRIVACGKEVYCTDAYENWLRYTGTPFKWTKVAGAGGTLVPNDVALYAIDAARTGISQYSPSTGLWTQIGGAAEALVTGGSDLYCTNAAGDVSRYGGSPFEWTKVGDPAAMFVANKSGLFSIGLAYDGVWQWSSTTKKWTQIGGAAEHIVAGGTALYAVDPSGYIQRYDGTAFKWTQIGGPVVVPP